VIDTLYARDESRSRPCTSIRSQNPSLTSRRSTKHSSWYARLSTQERLQVSDLGPVGGIDSSLVATIAVDAVGSRAVRGFTMPSRYSSDHSVADALELAKRLDIEITTLPIEVPIRH